MQRLLGIAGAILTGIGAKYFWTALELTGFFASSKNELLGASAFNMVSWLLIAVLIVDVCAFVMCLKWIFGKKMF